MFAWNSEDAAQRTKTASSRLAAILRRIFSMAASNRRERRLRLCETLSLGEKRFIAVVEYGKQKFLLAGTQQNISLLKSLDESVRVTDRASQPESEPD